MTTEHASLPAQAGARVTATREELWGALQDGDEYAAAAVVFAALEAGTSAEDVLLDVIAPVQAKVGTEWAANRISVAQEHTATAINERVIAALSHRPYEQVEATLGRVTVACVDGEWHALPARLLAETLRLRGWKVDFLGAQVPTPHLIEHLHRTGPDAVALSSSIPTRLPTAHATITACQAAGVPVLAGGAAFGEDGRFARLLGAEVWAPDARAAADRLTEGMPGTSLSGTHQAVDDLPHLADQEYTLITQSRPQLVKQTMAELEEGYAPMRAYSDAQRQRTAEDIAHIVDFLATALYTDDRELFTGFISWTGEILAARGVPADSLTPTLELLAGQLKDFPRAIRFLSGPGASADGPDAVIPSPGGRA